LLECIYCINYISVTLLFKLFGIQIDQLPKINLGSFTPEKGMNEGLFKVPMDAINTK